MNKELTINNVRVGYVGYPDTYPAILGDQGFYIDELNPKTIKEVDILSPEELHAWYTISIDRYLVNKDIHDKFTEAYNTLPNCKRLSATTFKYGEYTFKVTWDDTRNKLSISVYKDITTYKTFLWYKLNKETKEVYVFGNVHYDTPHIQLSDLSPTQLRDWFQISLIHYNNQVQILKPPVVDLFL